MIPVELRLSNFLSYGEETRLLDFSRFHVACLSGKNGQGKSALLDAITWVLWGEARKSSGGHKPDEELLRIGARRMKVEFVFDVEGVRHRVLRAYSRSASGKTSKVELELHLLGEGDHEGRPLTGVSIRETQDYITTLIGLDYQTFINSSFLLQGRSDEFTKKKPGDRKEILGRILNLGKYDRLALMARDRQRLFTAEVDVLDREIERLKISLEDESGWKARMEEVVGLLAERQVVLADTQEKEAAIREKLGALEAQSREVDALHDQILRLQAQIREHEEEIAQLQQSVENAQALFLQKAEIEANYARHGALVEERDELDMKREVFRGVEKQREQKQQDLLSRRREMEQRVNHQEMQRQLSLESLAELARNEEMKTTVERQLREAKEAQKRVERNREVEARLRALTKEKGDLEVLLAGEREKLLAQRDTVAAQRAALDTKLKDAPHIRARKKELEGKKSSIEELAHRIEQSMTTGSRLSEEIKQKEGEREALISARAKVSALLEQLERAGESVCPTCGSELTESHRDQVQLQLSGEVADFDHRLTVLAGEVEAQVGERDALRAAYRHLKKEEEAGASILEELARVEEQVAAVDRIEQERTELENNAAELKQRIETNAYGTELKAGLKAILKGLSELDYDEEKARADAFEAAQCDRYEEKLRQILMEEGKAEQLTAQIASLDKKIATMRNDLDTGEPFAGIKAEIGELDAKISELGFDSARYETVRVQLKELAAAHERMRDLVHAEKNLEEWKRRRFQLDKRRKDTTDELQVCEEKRKQLEVRIHAGEEVRRSLVETTVRREEIEREIHELQVQRGELQARMTQAGIDRTAMKDARQKRKDAKLQESLYGKLRRAFGKNGIPSLIIEQTLPEIENRTNELLDRLAEGKMRVRLETLKDKKTGGTRETLEIIIADEQGVARPYETFSGGEAFRVNFALRIALSQMLAARNGVQIRTLGIDEGFGTQDEDGIQNLIEAIQVIQNDFDKILVITHLDRLKEAFPVRIEIEKDPLEGSRFTLIEG